MRVTPNEYLDARGCAETGTAQPGWLDKELSGAVTYDRLARLVVISYTAPAIIDRLKFLGPALPSARSAS